MKSLNKTLSLVLALCLVFSLMGVASATNFKDDADIQYKEAVDVMTGIGAINGVGNDTFAPTATVTRAQAAKMVAYAVLGADVAKNLPAAATKFADVDATAYSWATGSINYLTAKGIINGTSSTTFEPEGKVTAYQLGKMLLCAAGYGVNDEFVGPNWAINVAVTANSTGIFKDTKATNFDTSATREEAALYCFNGITKVNVVSYSKLDGMYKEKLSNNAAYTIANSVYKMGDAIEGKLTAISNYDAKKELYTYTVATTTADDNETFSSKIDYSKFFQMDVKVYFTLDDGNQMITSMSANDSTVVAMGGYDITTALTGVAGKKQLEVMGTKYDAADTITAYCFNAADATGAQKYFTTKYIANNKEGKIDTAVVYPFEAKKVALDVKYNKVTLDNALATGEKVFDNGKDNDKNVYVAYEGIAKNDFVKVTKNAKGQFVFEKIDTVAGKVTKTKTEDSKPYVMIDGNWLVDGTATMTFGSYHDMAVVNNVIFYATEGEDVAKTFDYALVEGTKIVVNPYDSSKMTVVAKLLLADGTTVEKTLNNAYATSTTAAKLIVGENDTADGVSETDDVDVATLKNALVTYKADKDGLYELTQTADASDAKTTTGFDVVAVDETANVDEGKINGTTIADDAVVFTMNNGKDGTYKVITGKELANMKVTGNVKAYATIKSTATGFSTVKMALVDLKGADVAATADLHYGFVTGLATIKNDKDVTVTEITFYDGTGSEKTIAADAVSSLAKGDVFTYKLKADGTIDADNTAKVTVAMKNVAAYDSETGAISDGTNVGKITANTVIFYIDVDNSEVANNTDMSFGNDEQVHIIMSTVAGHTDEVAFIIFDADGGNTVA